MDHTVDHGLLPEQALEDMATIALTMKLNGINKSRAFDALLCFLSALIVQADGIDPRNKKIRDLMVVNLDRYAMLHRASPNIDTLLKSAVCYCQQCKTKKETMQ